LALKVIASIEIKNEKTISALLHFRALYYIHIQPKIIKMYLIFDGVSSSWYIWVFSREKKNICAEKLDIVWNESSRTSDIISAFLLKHDISYNDILNIICVVGPWSFTWVRSVTLVINTIAFIHPHISLTPLWFFDLYDNYPIVKSSSKRDLFVKGNDVYGDTDVSRFQGKYTLHREIDYDLILQKVSIMQEKRIAPLYIKKPTIT